MFKRAHQDEQPRPSRALADRKPAPDAEEGNAPRPGGSGPDAPGAGRAPAASHSVPRPLQDVNLSVAGPTGAGPAAPRDEHETLISEGSFFDGTYRTEESIRIRGRVRGEVASKRAIFVEAQATVTAKVIGMAVTVAGQVDGQIACGGRVELTPSARVTGEITAGTLIMQEGAFFEGQLKMASRGGEAAAVAVTTRR